MGYTSHNVLRIARRLLKTGCGIFMSPTGLLGTMDRLRIAMLYALTNVLVEVDYQSHAKLVLALASRLLCIHSCVFRYVVQEVKFHVYDHLNSISLFYY